MNRILYLARLLALACAFCSPLLAGAVAPAFPYPIVPDTVSSFEGRADYFVTHFWDHADLKRPFSNRQNFRAALGDWIAMMPHASASVSTGAIETLMEKLKKLPSDQAFIAGAAREMLYGDSARFWSDELMLPFAEAVAANKKAPQADRVRMEQLARILSTNRRGSAAPAPSITTRSGATIPAYIPSDSVSYQVLFFNDPTCDECDAARIRLGNDYLISRLIKAGVLEVTSIYPGESSDEEFATLMSRLPEGWRAGALPDADLVYDLRTQPCFYLLTGQGFIVEKNIDPGSLMAILGKLRRLKVAQPALDTPAETAPGL